MPDIEAGRLVNVEHCIRDKEWKNQKRRFPYTRKKAVVYSAENYVYPKLNLLDFSDVNQDRAGKSVVRLSEVVASPEFQNSSSPLTFAIGKDEHGKILIGDLEKEIHLLVAGTTGSGKSVFIHSLITSLLYKCTPYEVKFILIDSSGIELRAYEELPHLLTPVITDSSNCLNVLRECGQEMEMRLHKLQETASADIYKYNEKAALYIKEEVALLPHIVVIIDGLINIIPCSRKKEFEEIVQKLTQYGRAAGIHLVISTPRPSSRVLSGILKANIPSRISFEVTSSLESRINMDCRGAECLSHSGEMLYLPMGYKKPIHGQTAYTEDTVRDSVVKSVKENFSIQKITECAEFTETVEEVGHSDTYDSLFAEAVDYVIEVQRISIGLLQRKLKIGFNRALRIAEQMEDAEIISPIEDNVPGQILISREEWERKKEKFI